jgi:hypothetical protein
LNHGEVCRPNIKFQGFTAGAFPILMVIPLTMSVNLSISNGELDNIHCPNLHKRPVCALMNFSRKHSREKNKVRVEFMSLKKLRINNKAFSEKDLEKSYIRKLIENLILIKHQNLEVHNL